MYPEGTLVRVINNINNHWFEIGEIIAVELRGHSRQFVGRPTTRKTEDERYYIGGGPWVKWEEVILADPELSLEEMLKECLE
ncbi:MAG: hypothetical protein IM509_05535 [Microcystis sp. M31BS1]|uniref:hypothetical protein n=1 Tax=Microcystis sp. M31BS1 TaxID=2771186 RepID=UPI00258CC244|nr:hypothetical protein [Microcystis sp. M31BS1]MCA2590213.1 hypothetical protein [Microcystis sp. M31BS1]